jgi:hypothetical protein
MKNYLKVLPAFIFLFLLTSCSERLGDFTLLSTQNVEIGAKYKKIGTSEGKDQVFVFLVPFGYPNLKNATDEAIRRIGGELMTNAVVEAFNYSFIFGVMGYKVRGDIWKREGMEGKINNDECYELKYVEKKYVLVSMKNNDDRIDVSLIVNE